MFLKMIYQFMYIFLVLCLELTLMMWISLVFFFMSEESKEASNEKVELNDKFLVGDIVRLKIKNEF